MWKARRELRRRSSAAAAHKNDDAGPAESDDITSTSGRHYSRRSSHSPGLEHGNNENDALTQKTSPRDDRVPDKRSRPVFFKSIFNASSPSPPPPSSTPDQHQHREHHYHLHAPPIAPVMASAFVSKSRRVRFDFTLRIHDLNNVPLVSGTSFIKWHLPSSTSAEHRGRTPKAAIKDHRVVFGYEKSTSVRLVVGKGGMLQECWINFEVQQEYSAGGRGERIMLGTIRLNLAEYVEASEALQSPTTPGPTPSSTMAGIMGAATMSMTGAEHGTGHTPAASGEEGVTRRYLMQDSKINSTLKIGVYMRHAEGTRDYIAPPLRTAPVFGGIAGIISSSEPAAIVSTTGLNGKLDPEASANNAQDGDNPGSTPNLSSRNREAGEMQDMYRRTLAAFWASQPGELKADECIEDIFAGGDGWGKGGKPANISPALYPSAGGAGEGGGEDDIPAREGSGGGGGGGGAAAGGTRSRRPTSAHGHHHRRNLTRHHQPKVKSPRKGFGELDEMDVRDDLVGWRVSEKTYS